jgi:hypothetical protein
MLHILVSRIFFVELSLLVNWTQDKLKALVQNFPDSFVTVIVIVDDFT